MAVFGVVAKYDPLFRHLVAAGPGPVEMTFDEIERLVGPLPAAASRSSRWWVDERHDTRHVHVLAWLNAGRLVEAVDRDERTVRFSAARWRRGS